MAAATQTRADKIEEFVLRDAWGDVLYSLAQAVSELKIDDEILITDMTAEVTSSIRDELWPDDPNPEVEYATVGDPEFEAASSRAMALHAAILMQLTTADAADYLRSEAARFAKLAADHAREVGDAG